MTEKVNNTIFSCVVTDAIDKPVVMLYRLGLNWPNEPTVIPVAALSISDARMLQHSLNEVVDQAVALRDAP